MAAVTICGDFGAQESKICPSFHLSPLYLTRSDETGCMIGRVGKTGIGFVELLIAFIAFMLIVCF